MLAPPGGRTFSTRAFSCDSNQCCDDTESGNEGPSQSSRHFGFAAGAAPMLHRDLENAQTPARDAHLHFKVPPVGLLSHAELVEHIATDCSKWRHVRVFHAIQNPKQKTGNATGQNLLKIHTPMLALARGCANQ